MRGVRELHALFDTYGIARINLAGQERPRPFLHGIAESLDPVSYSTAAVSVSYLSESLAHGHSLAGLRQM